MVPRHDSVNFFFFLITVLFMLGNDFFFSPINSKLVIELTKPEVLLRATHNESFLCLRKLLQDSLINLPERLLVTLQLFLSCCPSTHIVLL